MSTYVTRIAKVRVPVISARLAFVAQCDATGEVLCSQDLAALFRHIALVIEHDPSVEWVLRRVKVAPDGA